MLEHRLGREWLIYPPSLSLSGGGQTWSPSSHFTELPRGARGGATHCHELTSLGCAVWIWVLRGPTCKLGVRVSATFLVGGVEVGNSEFLWGGNYAP